MDLDLTTGNFTLYWEFLKLFTSCTLMLSRNSRAWLDLYYLISEKCFMGQDEIACTVLQTNSDVVNAPYLTLPHDERLQWWLYTGFEDLDLIYLKVFWNTRHRPLCTVHFPSVERDNIVLPYHFYQTISYAILHTPEYVFLPIVALPGNEEQVRIPLWHNFDSKLILLNSVNYSMATACYICLPREAQYFVWYHGISLYRSELIYVPIPGKGFTSKEEFALAWTELLISTYTENPYGPMAPVSDEGCPYTVYKFYDLSEFHWLHMENCQVYQVLKKLNGTTRGKEHSVWTAFKINYLSIYGFSKEIYIPYGVQYQGLTYVTLVQKNSVDLNALALLNPIDTKYWVVLGVAIPLLIWILRKTKFRSNVPFFLYATILEQEDGRGKRLSWTNLYLVGLWLFFTILLRNVYVSSIYSYITENPQPQGLPGSFDELLYNNFMPIYTTTPAIRHFYKTYGSVKTQKSLRVYDAMEGRLREVANYNQIYGIFLGTNLEECRQIGLESSEYDPDRPRARATLEEGKVCLQRDMERFSILTFKTTLHGSDDVVKPFYLYSQKYHVRDDMRSFEYPLLNIWTARANTIFLRTVFIRVFSAFTESGEELFQRKYWDYISNNQIYQNFENTHSGNKGFDKRFGSFLKTWLKLGCSFYDKGECAIIPSSFEGAKASDLMVIWQLLITLLMLCSVIFLAEFVRREDFTVNLRKYLNQIRNHWFLIKNIWSVRRKSFGHRISHGVRKFFHRKCFYCT